MTAWYALHPSCRCLVNTKYIDQHNIVYPTTSFSHACPVITSPSSCPVCHPLSSPQYSLVSPSACSHQRFGRPLLLFLGVSNLLNMSSSSFLITSVYHSSHFSVTFLITREPFKCYVMLFPRKLDPHPPPHKANNVVPYTFVMLFSRKCDTHPPRPPSALCNT